MNAVTQAWHNQRHGSKPSESDRILEGLLSTSQLTPLGVGVATHAKGREIDHILVDNSSRARFSVAEVMPADTDTDHHIGYAEITTAAQTDGGGEQRPRGPQLHEWDEEHFDTYSTHMETWRTGADKSQMENEESEDKTHAHTPAECTLALEAMQQAMMDAANKIERKSGAEQRSQRNRKL